ncbi:unnamed protein product [Zymoseptoria tritici ST99CH_1A5]|uniref:Uncharacterized protein n=2 Tax=Zymoseptoria tritici TaxID=1047171 RepID=A0A1X7RSX3_ZYMT9|nr:unnamed protein product [Zymoseptoria tritici ST99CH_3D7]SMY24209.1 unnamed protein product [Zymoseptoria tritici ST99CH_1A5]
MHTPTPITDSAESYARETAADSIVSFGGGSTIGLGKALSIRTGLPHVCIVTTYSGSEMTSIVGETSEGKKTTRKDPKIFPATVIYDVDLTLDLPAETSAVSGVNAMAHAVEALYAQNKNPVTSMMALEGIKALSHSLPIIVQDPTDHAAREKALYGAWLCAVCAGTVGVALHHKLCHTLGGSCGLPHAETHTVVLPHALAYNAPAVPDAMHKLAEVLEGSDGDATRGVNRLLARLGVKRSLKDLGMKEDDVERAADIAMERPYWNPRLIKRDVLQEVVRRCWAGEEARSDL